MDTQIVADQRLYTVVEDLRTFFRLLVAGRVEDALTGEPVRSPLTVTVDRDDLLVKAAGDGLFAVGGDPELAFSLLSTDAYAFELTVRAPGYRQQRRTVNVPAGSSFPLPAVVFSLRRRPVRVQGRVTGAAADHPPIAGATVTIQAPEVLALRTPLAFDHAAGAEVRDCVLAPAGPPKQLELAAVAGDDTLTLSDRTVLAAGTILRFGPPERLELAVIESLAPQPADPNLAGAVTLSAPLRRSLPQGVPAQPVNPAPAAAQALAGEVAAGEGVVTLADPLNAAAVRIETADSLLVEYHAIGALTDVGGYYRLDGIAGIAGATLVASAAGFDDGEQPWVIDFATPVYVLDFRLETP